MRDDSQHLQHVSQEGKTMTDNLTRNLNQASIVNHGILLTAAIIVAVLLGWWAPWAPSLADAATVKGKVDVCVLKADLGKSWTKGLERKANARYSQRIDVQRITERQLDRGRHCDVIVWAGGKVAEDYVNGVPSTNPRYHVNTGPYAMVAGEVNVGTGTPRKQRVATMLAALQDLKTAGVFR